MGVKNKQSYKREKKMFLYPYLCTHCMNDLLEQKWEAVKELFESRFGKEPDLEVVLFLIGIQELRNVQNSFTKEQKEDLMHVATCTLLSFGGYYELENYDEDGWPHFKKLKNTPPMDTGAQEEFLRTYIIHYFERKELISIDSISSDQ